MVNKMVNRMNKELTRRQAGVLRALEDFVLKHGHAPTIRKLAESLGIASPSAAFKHVLSLEKKGYITRDGGELRLAGRPSLASGSPRSCPSKEWESCLPTWTRSGRTRV